VLHPKPPPLKPEREAKRRGREARERKAKDAAKVRDHQQCRWPRCRRRTVEGHHWEGKGIGGDHGIRSIRKNLIALCRKHHRAIHDGQAKIVPLTDRIMDGACEFFDNVKTHGSFASPKGLWWSVGRERKR
jgi:hypothetical protein